jgi:predicted aldo/keto reductase-like oxidoreductase
MIYSENKKSAWRDYIMCTVMRKTPSSASQCVDCGKCERHCPQSIQIRKELKAVKKELETPVYKIAKAAVGLFKLW